MHKNLFLYLSLPVLVALLVMLGQRWRVSYPIFLVIGGLLLSFVPGMPIIQISPDIIFLIFLPPLLFEAAWSTSWKDFWKWRRIISMLAFGLVIITSVVVAYVSAAMLPGFTLALGFLLGGIISPPDAVAATSVLRNIKLPRLLVSILEGESLLNDASSLIVFRFALAAVVSGQFIWQQALGSFVWVCLGGVGTGLGVGVIFYAIFRWLPTTPSIDSMLTMVIPFLLYLTAESFHVSGVLAVVSGGLFLSYHRYTFFNHSTRLQSGSLWQTLSFALNGLVFILIGLQFPTIVRELGAYPKMQAIKYSVFITALIIIVRVLAALGISIFTRFISRYIKTAHSNPGWRGPLVIGWAGMRGVVSLASALSIPLLVHQGQPFPQRNLILFITFVVILLTLVVQGFTLPFVIRWVKPADIEGNLPEEDQRAAIQLRLSKASLKHLEEYYPREMQQNAWLKKRAQQLQQECGLLNKQVWLNENVEAEQVERERYTEIRLDLLDVQRQELIKMHRNEKFDDELLREQEVKLDLEQQRLE